VVLAALMLVACTKQESSSIAASPVAADEAVGSTTVAGAGAANQQTPLQRDRTLAYEHTVALEVKKEDLARRVKDVQSACGSRAELGCTLLEIAVDEQADIPSARISMRVAPGEVDSMIGIAAQGGGRVTSRTTHGEDLAQPMADTERDLSLLALHRDRLSEFLTRKDLTVQQVIDLSKEISSSQAQIESLTARKANLRRRVDTELLTLNFSPPATAYAAVRTPVRDALRSFTDDFSGALALVIRFAAVLLPWLVLGVLAFLLWRLSVAWRSFPVPRRDQDPPRKPTD
jgi:hypothetical protein